MRLRSPANAPENLELAKILSACKPGRRSRALVDDLDRVPFPCVVRAENSRRRTHAESGGDLEGHAHMDNFRGLAGDGADDGAGGAGELDVRDLLDVLEVNVREA